MLPRQYYEQRKKAKRRLTYIIIAALLLSVVLLIMIIFREPQTITEVAKEIPPQKTVTETDATVEIALLHSCGHMKTEVIDLPSGLWGKTSDEIKLLKPEWYIKSFSKNLLEVEEKTQTACEDHFIVKLNGSKLQAFKKNNPNNIYKEMIISLNALTKEDIEILTAGIDVNSEYELLEILESFSELG